MPEEDLADLTPARARAMFRSAELCRPTSGLCTGYIQANLAFLPTGVADDFEAMCRLNDQPLPLIERLPAGQYSPRVSATDADLRTDLGGFMVYDGRSWTSVPDLLEHWRDDLVAFVIGCSFSAERALLEAGVHLRHVAAGGGVPIYRTTRDLEPAGGLRGRLVVSMRAIEDSQVDTAAAVTARYPMAHGGPVWTGPGQHIGCRDGRSPDWGVELPVTAEETPVYWACGVTPQTIIEDSGIAGAMVHRPGHMFITDIRDETVRDVDPADWRARHAC
ncbi:D-glutamate cyclase family protein [Aeromicrobium sp. CTD01-1L150]|uniref:D-glutamate cyclase family protein n=1 Tax=Aeromicrobium sp. CTD01-1L150 TaxID=3341830 RepID=UPI0035C06614